jgi:hypothetical protein
LNRQDANPQVKENTNPSRPAQPPVGWYLGEKTVLLARVALSVVLIANMTAAVPFVLRPADYAAGFELSGAAGEAAVRGFGILFLMWAVPFIPALIHPERHRAAFACVLAMQAIGLAGEALVFAGLPAGHNALRATGLRFIAFDGAGLVILLSAYQVTGRKPHGA